MKQFQTIQGRKVCFDFHKRHVDVEVEGCKSFRVHRDGLRAQYTLASRYANRLARTKVEHPWHVDTDQKLRFAVTRQNWMNVRDIERAIVTARRDILDYQERVRYALRHPNEQPGLAYWRLCLDSERADLRSWSAFLYARNTH